MAEPSANGNAPAPALLRTPLYDWHKANGGRLVEFGGWQMPVQYGSIVAEHEAVRARAGLFDIGHMGRLEFRGPDAPAWLEHATTNRVARLAPGQIQYSLMANPRGGIVDDVLVYRLPGGDYRMVCNASNRGAVLEALEQARGGREAEVLDHTLATAMVAVQGPGALEIVRRLIGPGESAGPDQLKYYHCAEARVAGAPAVLSRTGYTGEDGFEIIVERSAALPLWVAILDAGQPEGLIPCGLGARDTLRLEAGMPLYGHELSATINPYSAGLGWAVKLDKGDFVGRGALLALKADPGPVRVGLELPGRRIARQGAPVLRDGAPAGEVCSGTFSPTLQKSIAMAYVPADASAAGIALEVDIRGQPEPARVVPLPFYKRPGA